MNLATREILLSFWKVHILHHASERPLHGQWVVTELRRHGYEISPGTLYPLLHRMERHGWLKCRKVPGGGPRARRNYRLTADGQEALAMVRAQLQELYREVVIEAAEKPRRPKRPQHAGDSEFLQERKASPVTSHAPRNADRLERRHAAGLGSSDRGSRQHVGAPVPPKAGRRKAS